VSRQVAARVAARYPTRFLRHYVRGKIASDPLYGAVFDRLRDTRDPILDVGCGAGFLAWYLRERGLTVPIRGVDHDEAKITMARRVADESMSFVRGDAGDAGEWSGTVLMLDLLHYLDSDRQRQMLERAASQATTVVVRDAINDGSWRYRMTYAQETFARAIGWLNVERLHFPTRETITTPFGEFSSEVVPLWGSTPFNNYLFVFRRTT